MLYNNKASYLAEQTCQSHYDYSSGQHKGIDKREVERVTLGHLSKIQELIDMPISSLQAFGSNSNVDEFIPNWSMKKRNRLAFDTLLIKDAE